MKALLLVLLLLLCSTAQAEITGYLAQSLVLTDNISLAGSSGSGYSIGTRKTELALFGTLPLSSSTIRWGIGTRDEPGLNYGQVDIRYLLWDIPYNISSDSTIGLRLGRVPHNLGYFNKWRNNPREGEFIYLPAGIYREQFKWLAMSGDGVQLYLNKSFHNSDLSIYTTLAKPGMDMGKEVVAGHANDQNAGKFIYGDSYIRTFNIEYTFSKFSLHYDFTYLDWAFVSNKAYGPYALDDGRLGAKVHTAGVRYYCTEDLDITVEYLYVSRPGNVWDKIKLGQEAAGALGRPEGYVLSIRNRLSSDTSITLATTRYSASNMDKYGRKVSALSGVPAKFLYTTSNSISVNHKLDEFWSVRSEYTQGKGVDSFVVGVQDPNSSENWRYLAIQLIYSF